MSAPDCIDPRCIALREKLRRVAEELKRVHAEKLHWKAQFEGLRDANSGMISKMPDSWNDDDEL